MTALTEQLREEIRKAAEEHQSEGTSNAVYDEIMDGFHERGIIHDWMIQDFTAGAEWMLKRFDELVKVARSHSHSLVKRGDVCPICEVLAKFMDGK